MKNFLLIIAAFMVLTSATQPQIIKKEEVIRIVRKINTEMYAHKHFGTDLIYYIYKNHSDSVAAEKMQGFYYRSGTKEHSMVVGVETIQDEKSRLVVDSNSQSIIVTDPKAWGGVIDESLIAALNYCSKIERLVGTDQEELILHIQSGMGIGFSKINVVYDKRTFWIKKLTLCYVNMIVPGFGDYTSPKVEINYVSVSDDRIKQSEYDFKKFLVKVNGHYTATEPYKTYTFTNLQTK